MVRRMLAAGLLTISMSGLGVACGGGDEDGSCSSDNDCKGDRVCDGGECISPSTSNPNNTPSNNTPSNNTPSNNTPSNNTPSNNTPSNNTPSNNTPSEGAIGSDCLSAVSCDSAYCREEAGAIGGICAVNDFGDMCEGNGDCEYGACLFENIDVDVFGYCTAQCESFSDCPSFWDCGEVGNASGTYCIQD